MPELARTEAISVSGTQEAGPGTLSEMFDVSLRRIPYPYRAILAICSDLDETPDRHVYLESMRFLNTLATTSMGPGVGLEIGNSIYFDMPPDQFSYWNTDGHGRSIVRDLIHSGHTDCLHSFGDLATTRDHAARALDELSRHDCRIEAWVDHAVAPSNFDGDIMCGHGDVPGSKAYHADLTCDYGIRYVWRGRVSSVLGQEVPRSLRGICNSQHPMVSARTVVKEGMKGILAYLGNMKYAMHGPNRILRGAQLRDGHKVYEFLRSNPHWGGVSRGETADGLAEVLIEPMLTRLIERQGVCLLYTHLGKVKRREEPFGPLTRKALRLLAKFYHEGKILVTTTRRLLGYCRAVREVAISTTVERDSIRIDVSTGGQALSLADFNGLSFYVSDPWRTRVTLNGREVFGLKRNGSDHTGRLSVSIPWNALEFPDL